MTRNQLITPDGEFRKCGFHGIPVSECNACSKVRVKLANPAITQSVKGLFGFAPYGNGRIGGGQ